MHLNGLSYCFTIDQISFRVSMLSDGIIHDVIPGHSHAKGCYEIHCVTDGAGIVLLGEARFPVTAGSIYVTGPHIFHEQTPDKYHPMAELCVYMQLLTPMQPHTDAHVNHQLVPLFLQQFCWIGADTTGILPIMKQIFSEATAPDTIGHMTYMSGLFMQLFCLLVRCYQANPNMPAMPQLQNQTAQAQSKRSTSSQANLKQLNSSNQKQLRQTNQNLTNLLPDALSPLAIEEAFLNNYQTITLSDLAAATHLSIRQLQRLIQKQYGTTFQKKRTQARISAACILLRTTSCSLGEIAEQTGYSSPEHFSYAFRQQMGCTPGAYRKNNSKTALHLPEPSFVPIMHCMPLPHGTS